MVDESSLTIDALVPVATAAMLMRGLPLCRDPIFIIGAQRSGTSILARSLGKHSLLWYSVEGQVFSAFLGHRQLASLYDSITTQQWHWLNRERVSRAEFYEAMGFGLNALYTSRSGGRRWVEKQPENTLVADTLAAMLPGASFIHILRDGRHVVHSMINKADAPRWRRNFARACRDWREYTRSAAEFTARYPHRCLTVRNEHLAANPHSGFREIFRFLDIGYEDGPAEFFRSTRINSSFTHRAGGTPADPCSEWTPRQRRVFLSQTAHAMVQHGFMSEEEVRAMRAGAAPGGLSQLRDRLIRWTVQRWR